MRLRPLALLSLLLPAAPPLLAQSFDVPAFQTPFVETGVGVYAFSPRADEYGGMATWRQGGDRTVLGVRGGFVNVADEESYFAGVEVLRGVESRDSTGGEVALVTGFGVGWVPDADFVRARLPIGLTWGHRRVAGSLAYVPYLHPRLVLDVDFVDEGDGWDEDLDLGAALDLGFDLEIQRSLLVRFGATIGHEDAIGAGLAFAF